MQKKHFIPIASLLIVASFSVSASCVSILPEKKEVRFEVHRCISLEEAMKELVARCTETMEEYDEKSFCEWVRKNPDEAKFVYKLETMEETIKRCTQASKNSKDDFCNSVREYPDEFKRASKQLSPSHGVLLEGKTTPQKAAEENKEPLPGRRIVYYGEKADCVSLLGKKLMEINARRDCCDTVPGNPHCVLANGVYVETIGN